MCAEPAMVRTPMTNPDSAMRIAAVPVGFLLGGCRLSPPAMVAPLGSAAHTDTAAAVRYPAMLIAANVEGAARVRFALDPAGRPIPHSIRELTSSHPLFAQALTLSVRRWAFAAADRSAAMDATDSVTVDARLLIRDSDDCPHPPRCSDVLVRIPPPRERVERGVPGQLDILVMSCPEPSRAHCTS